MIEGNSGINFLWGESGDDWLIGGQDWDWMYGDDGTGTSADGDDLLEGIGMIPWDDKFNNKFASVLYIKDKGA